MNLLTRQMTDVELPVTTAALPPGPVHAVVEGRPRTVCGFLVMPLETSNALFEFEHPDNCKHCEEILHGHKEAGVLR